MKEEDMSFTKYRKEVLQILKKHIADQEYLNALEPDIRKHYEEELNVSELVGENQISPDGYALGILFGSPKFFRVPQSFLGDGFRGSVKKSTTFFGSVSRVWLSGQLVGFDLQQRNIQGSVDRALY